MIKDIIHWFCVIVGVLGAVVGGIWAIVLQIQNPDATEMRIILDNPALLVLCVVCFILVFIGGLTSEPRSKRRW